MLAGDALLSAMSWGVNIWNCVPEGPLIPISTVGVYRNCVLNGDTFRILYFALVTP